jgi:TIR domain
MSKLFISHSFQDDAFVRDLRATLADHRHEAWIAPRELQAGDLLWSELQKAIDEASAFVVVVSPAALQSTWVGKELRYALDVQKQRGGKDNFPVIPLSLNGTKLGVWEGFFSAQLVYIPVSSQAGGVEAALNAILTAITYRLAKSTATSGSSCATYCRDEALITEA